MLSNLNIMTSVYKGHTSLYILMYPCFKKREEFPVETISKSDSQVTMYQLMSYYQ